MYFQTRSLPLKSRPSLLCRTKPKAYPYALISTAKSNDNANTRYDIIFAYPQNSIVLNHQFELVDQDDKPTEPSKDFLDAFDREWKHHRLTPDSKSSDLPFTGGWFIYLSYELVKEIEPALDFSCLDNIESNLQNNQPIAIAVRCPAAIVVDHHKNTYTIVAENEYAYLLDTIEQDYLQCEDITIDNESITVKNISEAPSALYLKQLSRLKRYIYDGDIFQANLSRLWQVVLDNDVDNGVDNNTTDMELFEVLASNNPSGFAAYVRFNDLSIISSSPERLVSCRHNIVETRPIAGTRPRARSEDNDKALADELMEHPKEQAEHIMLIDLERNDLGRICIPGSIRVDELMTLESYQHVHHIVSNVQGRIRDNVTPSDIIRAVFPGGTITGCPKVRCMQILAELEQQSRGAYTGSLGYINRDGSMDLNILIRTMVRQGNTISFRAGGGVVADSDPLHELEETRAKAKGMLKVFNKRIT